MSAWQIPLSGVQPKINTPQETLAAVLKVKQLQQDQQQAAQINPLKLQEAQQTIQANQMDLAEKQRQAQERQTLDRIYTGAVRPDPTTGVPTVDRNFMVKGLTDANMGHLVPGLLKSMDDQDEAHSKVLKAKADLQEAHTELGASMGRSWAAADYDPAKARSDVAVAVGNGSVDPQNAKQFISDLGQASQVDPTGAAAKAVVKKYSEMFQSASEKMTTARARETQANTTASEAPARIALTQAQAGEAQGKTQDAEYARAVSDIGAQPPASLGELIQRAGKYSPKTAERIMGVIGQNYDPAKSPALLNQSAMTPEQRFNANKPLADRNPTEASLALTVAKGKAPGATPQEAQESQQAEAALRRLDQSKIASRPNVNVNMTPEQSTTTAGAIAAGTIDPQTARAMLRRQPGLLGEVLRVDPSFDEAQLLNRYQTAKEFSNSSNSKAGGQVLALNTLIHHADLYMQTAEALKNGTFRPGNAAYNAVASAFGSAPPTNADLVARFFAGETGKVATGGVPAEGEINGILKNLSSSNSPEQIAQAGKTLLQIAAGRATPLQEKLKEANLDKVYHVFGPDAQSILSRRGLGAVMGQANAQPAKAPPAGTVQQGYKFKGGDPADRNNWVKVQ